VVNVIEAALIGGFIGAVIVSAIGILVDWRRVRQHAEERQRERVHTLEVRVLEQRHQLRQAAMEDAARLRDARFARLNQDARELAMALFDLERLARLLQWGQSADRAELDRLEVSAHARFESARAGLTLDPDGGRLTATFESLTGDIEQYKSMLQSHHVLVEARAVDQVVAHADQMEAQRAKVVEGIMAAVRETQSLLESVAVPIEAPASPTLEDPIPSSAPEQPRLAPRIELAVGSPPGEHSAVGG